MEKKRMEEQTMIDMKELTGNLDAFLLMFTEPMTHLEHLLRELLVTLHLGGVGACCILFLDCHDQIGKNRDNWKPQKQHKERDDEEETQEKKGEKHKQLSMI